MNTTGWQKVGSALLRQQVLELRITGKTIRDIARIVAKSPTRVHEILVSALSEVALKNAETTEQIVQIELERLDAMIDSLWPLRHKPSRTNAIAKLMERRSKLLGLDKPTQTEIGGFGGAPLIPPVIEIGFKNGGPGKPSGDTGAEGP